MVYLLWKNNGEDIFSDSNLDNFDVKGVDKSLWATFVWEDDFSPTSIIGLPSSRLGKIELLQRYDLIFWASFCCCKLTRPWQGVLKNHFISPCHMVMTSSWYIWWWIKYCFVTVLCKCFGAYVFPEKAFSH